MKELKIASNMIALARNRKGANKRSAMLRMIMPMLSKETGDKLADAIAKKSSKKFAQIWDHIKHEIKGKLDHQHMATASEESYADVRTFQRDGETSVCIETYGPRKIRIAINGETIVDNAAVDPGRPIPSNENCGGMPVSKNDEVVCAQLAQVAEPADPNPGTECPPTEPECGTVSEPMATVQVTTENTGQTYTLTGDQMCQVIKQVCERLLMGADPCPLKPSDCCAKHDWPDCKVCQWTVEVPDFDFNANILELYDVLTAASKQL